MNQPSTTDSPASPLSGSERDILLTLFDLGRKVTSVIDLDELLPRIPELVGRLIQFDAFAVYFFKEKTSELTIAYSVGYPEDTKGFTLRVPDGLLGTVVATQQPVVRGDVTADPQYINLVPGMLSTLAVPLVHKAKS